MTVCIPVQPGIPAVVSLLSDAEMGETIQGVPSPSLAPVTLPMAVALSDRLNSTLACYGVFVYTLQFCRMRLSLSQDTAVCETECFAVFFRIIG